MATTTKTPEQELATVHFQNSDNPRETFEQIGNYIHSQRENLQQHGELDFSNAEHRSITELKIEAALIERGATQDPRVIDRELYDLLTFFNGLSVKTDEQFSEIEWLKRN